MSSTTVSTGATSAASNGTKTRKAARKGIKVERYFTREGAHPYDELEWDVRDAVIKAFTGEVKFEQNGVEIPSSWSLNATNIVAEKYFRGKLGTPERETSVRQIVDRVADTITDWGRNAQYFATEKDAVAFNEELKYLLINQMGAFNSPVWFNVGVPDVAQQVSACFILDVEDRMRSILNWYVEEGIIFQGGSGSGANLSRIRSSKEQLSGGGTASGPISFMRGADASAGTIKSGGKTRRAAKMVILNADHPDVEEFIQTKAIEERKGKVLSANGFDTSFTGDHAYSLQYQNANNSVGVGDAFMQAVLDDGDHELKAVSTGETVKTIKARDLMRQIATAAWECADPGLFYLDTVNNWHTSPSAGPIMSSNPCGEFIRQNNSSCNLASLNLVKFVDEDGNFDTERYIRAVEVFITAMDILVEGADFPTPAIAANTARYRELGLGYTNLGALLMRNAMAYDSDEGRAYAAALTAVMGGAAYRRSAVLAQHVGTYEGYEPDADAHQRVVAMHRDAVAGIDADLAPAGLYEAAAKVWDDAVEAGARHGFRNAQVTLLAPTGTISFMMDCDTTGIEPDLGLVKSKKLAGGGTMMIANESVRPALVKLGYSDDEVEAIATHIKETGSAKGSALKPEHVKVFQCAMGEDSITAYGHMKMMAATQPFLSGAISKTVNLPEETTIEEIEQIYIDAWQMGIKDIALYRDNCKAGQPLSIAGSKADKANQGSADDSSKLVTDGDVPTGISPTAFYDGAVPPKFRLPSVRSSVTEKLTIGTVDVFITHGCYEDGTLGEVFIKMAKEGGTLESVLSGFATAVSMGLQHGVPLEQFVTKFRGHKFEPSGLVTGHPNLKMASSIFDAIARLLAYRYLGDVAAVQVPDQGEPVVAANAPAPLVKVTTDESPKAPTSTTTNAGPSICGSCGALDAWPAGSCLTCRSCGETSGCS